MNDHLPFKKKKNESMNFSGTFLLFLHLVF